MIVFLWDACGSSRFYGVSDDESRARQAAESCIGRGAAGSARVEVVQLVTGFAALTSHYKRTGRGWTAQRHRQDGVVTWTPFAAEIPT